MKENLMLVDLSEGWEFENALVSWWYSYTGILIDGFDGKLKLIGDKSGMVSGVVEFKKYSIV